MKNKRSVSLYAWGLPLIISIVAGGFIFAASGRIAREKIGKPDTVYANAFGKVEAVLIKPGDSIAPGKELLSYIVTDRDGFSEMKQTEKQGIDITVKTISGQHFEDCIELPGLTEAIEECEVSAKVSGQIETLLFEEGQKIKAGEILATVEKKDYQLALEQASSAFSLAQTNFERVKKLLNDSAVSKSGYDEAQAQYFGAKAAMDTAKLALSRCSIVAPISGIVEKRMVHKGEHVMPGASVCKISDVSRIKITVGIPEQDISEVRNLKKINFYVDSLKQEFSGTVNAVLFSGSDSAKVYPLIIHADNTEDRLLPGMIVTARVVRKVYENAVVLPLFSVIAGDNEYYTFVEQDGYAVKRILKLGEFQGKNVHVIEGLKPADRIIDKGLRMVADNSSVCVIDL